MKSGANGFFVTVRSEGGLLPSDLLQKLAIGSGDLGGLKPENYHLAANERINEAVARSWTRLLAVWQAFDEARSKLPEEDRGTTLTREKWLLILFQEFGYGRLPLAKDLETDSKSYPISHYWNHSPIHLVGFRTDLDRRTPRAVGAASASPHSMTQEFLNRSKDHMWGFISNGLRLRILRDNKSLTRQAYVEFDLESMMEGEVYSDFHLLWLLCHQSRIEAEKPEDCWLEKWMQAAKDQGTRALEHLREGVERAIKALGTGFLAQTANKNVRDNLRSGKLTKEDYYRQLLRLVYRIIFLFVAEDRDLLFTPQISPGVKEKYNRYYSASRLRKLAEKIRGTKHPDLYHGLSVVMEKLGADEGCTALGLPALGSFLWSKEAIQDLIDCNISNDAFLEAVRSLSFMVEGRVLRAIDYKNLGAEELGSIYESLLELHPQINTDAATFDLIVAAGHERKTTGSYYTHPSLVQCLLDSALEPVLEEAVKKPNPEEAVLDLKICDPACGSGHFLIAAAHRIAKRLAAIRTGDLEPSPDETRKALRDVIGKCMYGVDINPMAVELCKVSLWMEALESGKPLSFLENKIQFGNSLLGTTPALLKKGIPDEAFEPIEGDDKDFCKRLKKRNKDERQGQGSLFDDHLKPWDQLGNLAVAMTAIDDSSDETIQDIRTKQKRYEEFIRSSGYLYGRLLADAWCAAFVWKKIDDEKMPYPITESVFRMLEKNPHAIPKAQQEEIIRIAREYQFFHWHLAFPDVFRILNEYEQIENKGAGWSGGFDIVLGNPPWDQIQTDPQEFFSGRFPEISNITSQAERDKRIKLLQSEAPELYDAYSKQKRETDAAKAFLHSSGLYPLTSYGRLNMAPIFAERCTQIVSSDGYIGIIVPTGIATDSFNQYFFSNLIESKKLKSLYDFENRDRILFPEVYYRMRFCLLTISGAKINNESPEFVFFALNTTDAVNPLYRFNLTLDDFQLMNPNTKTCPTFRSVGDANLTKKIYQLSKVLVDRSNSEVENKWEIETFLMFMMNTDSKHFLSSEKLEEIGAELKGNIYFYKDMSYLPLYEGRMIDFMDHRYASTVVKKIAMKRSADSCILDEAAKKNPDIFAMPRYWVEEKLVQDRHREFFDRKWTLGYMSITSSTNERTAIFTILPISGLGNSITGLLSAKSASLQACLLANFCSLLFDYVCKQKISGNNFNQFVIEQTPVLTPEAYQRQLAWLDAETIEAWLRARVLEMVFTSTDLASFAEDLNYHGMPFIWDDKRRFIIRCEMDALYFHLYDIQRDDVDYIIESFSVLRRKEDEMFKEYLTKKIVLEIYDEMAEAIRTGKPYKTRLDPPPADPKITHSVTREKIRS